MRLQLRVCAAVTQLAVAASLLLGTAARADTIVIPSNLDGSEGGTTIAFPLQRASSRYQQLFPAAQFTSQGVSGQIAISGVRFRRNGGASGFAAITANQIRIDLSTTSAAVGTMSMTFANNTGADVQTVFGGASGGALTVSSLSPDSTPSAFDISIDFDTPFLYDPADGNLLIDYLAFAGNTSIPNFDGAISGIAGQAAAVFNTTNANSATGSSAPNTGIATQLVFTAATPEPGTFGLFGLGLVAAGFCHRRRRRQPAAVPLSTDG